MFDDYTTERLRRIAFDAAGIAARDYVGIDHDDIAGHIIERVFRARDRFEVHIDNDKWLWAVMYAEGIAYCNKQVRNFMYYSDQYFYTPREVRELLEMAYTTDVRDGEYIHISDATVSLIDLQVAFNKLNFRDRDLISLKLGEGTKLDETDRRAYYRATEHLTAIMNGAIARATRSRVEHEGPGSRKVLTNAQAINKTRKAEVG